MLHKWPNALHQPFVQPGLSLSIMTRIRPVGRKHARGGVTKSIIYMHFVLNFVSCEWSKPCRKCQNCPYRFPFTTLKGRTIAANSGERAWRSSAQPHDLRQSHPPILDQKKPVSYLKTRGNVMESEQSVKTTNRSTTAENSPVK